MTDKKYFGTAKERYLGTGKF